MNGRGGLDPNRDGDDWARYGGARGGPGGDESEELRDNPFAAYRYESGRPSGDDWETRRSRLRSNLLGILIAVILIGAAAAVVNLAAPKATVQPSPHGTPRPAATLTQSPPP